MAYTPDTALRDVVLSTRSCNGLASLEPPPETLADLAAMTAAEAMRGRYLGRKSIRELRRVLAEAGLDFAPEAPPPEPAPRLCLDRVQAVLAWKRERLAPGPRRIRDVTDLLGLNRSAASLWGRRGRTVPDSHRSAVLAALCGPWGDVAAESDAAQARIREMLR